ncbi:MAG TPA: sigma-70 family RNA polymerase sigma factor [Terriglobales bacterium]|jgi:RNA polymerase sigma-70 factor (ECF subfamily)|nr:sigma-70 family RNA polymerase sigma factor [Terriglobales bacterium]
MSLAAYYAVTWMQDEATEIAHGLRHRDPEVLDRLIEQYQHRLFRYLVYLTGNRTAAEDLFQETWVRVLERGRQYDGKSKFETWLFAIARHLLIDSLRRKSAASLDALRDPEEGTAPYEPADEGPSAYESLAGREQEAQVTAAIAGVPAVYREVLVLRFQEDLKLEEIASVVGAPVSTVKSRLYRGLEAIRQALQGGQA